MLHIIVDAPHGDDSIEAKPFYSEQLWQMNLFNAMNHAQGVAQFLAQQKGLSEGNWHLASPIHWEATHNDAMIVAEGARHCSSEDLTHFFQVFQGFLERDDLLVRQITPGLWLFDAKQLQVCPVPSLDAVMHRSLQEYLQMMSTEWRTWFTEIQMLFHSAFPGTNPIINGVWPWGAGAFQLPNQLHCLGEFSDFNTTVWDPSQALPKSGVLLVSAEHASIIENLIKQKKAKHMAITWWWTNKNYQVLPDSLWATIKSWFSHAN